MSTTEGGWSRVWPTTIAGLSIGVGVSLLPQVSVGVLVGLLALAVACEWVEVRLGSLGSLTLRPVIAFVALWHQGLGLYLLVGLLPVLLMRGFTRRREWQDALPLLGLDAASLWLGYAVYIVLLRLLNSVTAPLLAEPVARALGVLAFWAATLAVRAWVLSISEGLRFRPAIVQLGSRAWRHALVLSAVAVLLAYINVRFELVVTGLTVVVLIEAYYPWKLLSEQEGVLITSVQMMAQAVDLKDPYTSNHSQRVSRYAVRLARTLGLPEEEVERIRVGALMHDIGKIGISGRIIRKPGRLTPEEQALMRQHSIVSANIIAPLEILGESSEMVRHHHEDWDGSGYPDGLSGASIPLGSRIIFVADAYDALVTDRPYRKGATKAEALEVIRKHSGTQFAPDVALAFERISDTL